MLIYELHVKGFTKRHPEVPENLRGTYAGLSSDAAIRYLKNLGITAVELLPVQEPLDDRHLVERGLVNYWGYNTLGYFDRWVMAMRRLLVEKGVLSEDEIDERVATIRRQRAGENEGG